MAKDKHDLIFKLFLSKRKNFIAFCRTYLPEEIKQRIDWNSVKLFRLSGEHVGKHIGNSGIHKTLNDIAYIFKYKSGQTGIIIVHIEHQSYWDKLVKLRLIQYVAGSLLDFHDKYKPDKLPSVIPIVFYHGKTKVDAEDMDLYDLFLEPELMKQYFTKPLLIDLSQYDEMDLIEHPEISAFEIIMKHSVRKTGDLNKINYVNEAFRRTWYDLDPETRQHLFSYFFDTWDVDKEQWIAKIIQENSRMEGLAMTLAEQFRMEGRQVGRQVGRQEGRQEERKEMVHKLIEAGIDIKAVQAATELSDEEFMTILEEVDVNE